MTEPQPATRLETGWFANTPVDDTLIRQFVIANAEWMESTAMAAGNPVLHTDDVVAVDEHSQHVLFNTGILLRPMDPDRADAVAAQLMNFYRGAGGAFSLFCPWPTTLPGFTAGGHPPLMLRMPGGERPVPPTELVIEAAATREGLGDYEQVLVEGFPLESLQPWRAGVALHPANLHVPGTRFYVGRVDGRPVSVATSIAGCGVNHIEFVATLPDARGRGYGAAVTWAATLAEPDLPALLVATDMGRPVYERMGYVALTRWAFLVCARV
jgi:GNAT superfamily N-acetyltransferase